MTSQVFKGENINFLSLICSCHQIINDLNNVIKISSPCINLYGLPCKVKQGSSISC